MRLVRTKSPMADLTWWAERDRMLGAPTPASAERDEHVANPVERAILLLERKYGEDAFIDALRRLRY